jgi:hypothetical protein
MWRDKTKNDMNYHVIWRDINASTVFLLCENYKTFAASSISEFAKLSRYILVVFMSL